MGALAAGLAALAIAPAAQAAKPQPASGLEVALPATDRPVGLAGIGYRPGSAGPEQMARDYLRHATGALGLVSAAADLQRTTVREGLSGTVVRFRQSVGGVPVYGPDVAVKLDRDGRVTHVAGGYVRIPPLAVTLPALSAAQARAIAFDHLRLQRAAWERTGLVVFPGSDRTRLAYQVDVLPGAAPGGEWRVLVDALTGQVFGAEDHALYATVDGSATVFEPDPLSSARATYGTPGYVDGGDADTPQLTAQALPRVLRGITEDAGTFRLAGPWAECVEFDAPTKGCFSQSSSNWAFTRGPDAFEAANTYYAIDTYMRYLNETLALGIRPHQYAGGVQYDPHGVGGDDNSFYSSSSGRLSFGEGGVDDAEDADVIVHELGHGLHNWVIGGPPSQVQGLSEGVGDFAAADYSRSFGHWTATDPQYHWVFDWDGHNPFWPGRVTNWTDGRTYPTNLTGQIHTDGQFWSSCNMQVWDAIGRDATVTAHWEGLAMTNSSTNQLQAAQAVVQAAVDLGYDVATVDKILSIYRGCGYAVEDPPAALSIGDATVTEGDAGQTAATFTLRLTRPAGRPFSVTVATTDGSATSPEDFSAVSATVSFDAGDTQQTFSVPVNGDVVDEPDETFAVDVSGLPDLLRLGDGSGVGTILDDDRDGVFTCRATALRIGSSETAVANGPDAPCRDDARTLAAVPGGSGPVSVSAAVASASTDEMQGAGASSAPAAGVVSTAAASGVRIAGGVNLVTAGKLSAQAQAVCTDAGTPSLSGGSHVADIRVNGVPVASTSQPRTIRLFLAELRLNVREVRDGRVVQRAFVLDHALQLDDVVIGEAAAGFKGTPAHPEGQPCA